MKEYAELADEYQAGTDKCIATGYAEYGEEFQHKRKMVVAALRAYACWLPFDTAPKDGTPILCFHPDDVFSPLTGIDLIWYEPSEKHWTMDGDSPTPFATKPTHWRPLPPPPDVSVG